MLQIFIFDEKKHKIVTIAAEYTICYVKYKYAIIFKFITSKKISINI